MALQDGLAAILVSAVYGRLEVVRLVLIAGADVDLAMNVSKRGKQASMGRTQELLGSTSEVCHQKSALGSQGSELPWCGHGNSSLLG